MKNNSRLKMPEKCPECGKQLDAKTAHLDHIVPLAEGGSSDVSNLRYICPSCNHRIGWGKAAVSLELASNPSKFLADLLFESFQTSPVKTMAVTIASTVALMSLIFLLERERQDLPPPTYESQIDKLNETKRTLDELVVFVENQKESIEAEQNALSALSNERTRLKPLLEADRSQIEALFREQEVRSAARASNERWIGFGLGVLASLIASLILTLGARVIRRKMERSTNQ